MNEKENAALVQQAYAMFGRGDLAGVLKLMGADVVWEVPEVDNVPFTGKFQGPEGVGRFFAGQAAAVDILKFEPTEFIAQGDKVVVLGDSLYKTKEQGKEYGGKFAQVVTVKDGKVQRFDHYGDTAAAAKAFSGK